MTGVAGGLGGWVDAGSPIANGLELAGRGLPRSVQQLRGRTLLDHDAVRQKDHPVGGLPG